ncbi:MAG TPA: hypothetical protein VK621_01050, partial [Bradyrhizobium sp.]|nr:hypothetical protein [Bradyrhizobium sp.]
MHAGTDLGLDGTEPAHYRTLVRPDNVESRGQMSSKKDKNAKDQIAIAKPEARRSRLRPRVASVRQIVRGLGCSLTRVAARALIVRE